MTMINLKKALSVLCAGVLLLAAGCGGGGGGSPGSSFGGTGSSGGSTTPTGSITLAITLTDAATGASTNSISLGQPAKASARLTDAAGLPIPNAVVTFTGPATLVALTPSAGTALTDSSGVASIQVGAAGISSAGAGTLTASAQVSGAERSGSIGFSVGQASVRLEGMTVVGQPPLSPYGTSSVTVNIAGVPTTFPVTVNFTSLCANQSKATLPTSVQSVNGVASATYTDNGCASTDTITASIAGSTVSATTNLAVAAPGIASIQFVSATPSTIVLKGTGSAGFQENSLVKFKLVDNNNQPIPNQSIKLDLTTRSGGILLDTSPISISKLTDARGEVQVSVQSGSTPTAVWVTAEITSGGTTFRTLSNKLTISTGQPAQDRFSLSAETLNIEGWHIFGTETKVIGRASDRLGNPVPDGTTINFISSGGQVQPSCQTTDGSCTVAFRSANPRPTDIVGEPSEFKVTAGRAVVLAYSLGEESFIDLDGLNTYQTNEDYNDLGNVFLDINENGAFDGNAEQTITFNGNNKLACVKKIANSPPSPLVPNTCDGVWGPAHVRQSLVITMSGSFATMSENAPLPDAAKDRSLDYSQTGATGPTADGLCAKSFGIWVYDLNRNPLPAGTRLSVSTGSLPDKVSAEVLPATVANTSATGGTLHTLTVKRTVENGACPLPNSDFSVTVVATAPSGAVSSETFLVDLP